MKIYEYKKGMRLDGERAIALGFFDGLHIGHRKLLESAVFAAEKEKITSAVFTFRADSDLPKLSGAPLYTDTDKAELISSLGIDELIVADFSDIKNASAEDFINGILIGELGCRVAISGSDFRFGRGAAGDVGLLGRKMKEGGGDFIEVGEVTLSSRKVSTTAIKKLLSEGNIRSATAMLGAPYFVRSCVTHGRGVGKTLGFPTINTDIGGRVTFLKHGVYKTETEIDGICYPSLTNVGRCPTFGEHPAHLETFVIDFDGDLYGKSVKIFFLAFIREEEKFSSPEELIRRIELDVSEAKSKNI